MADRSFSVVDASGCVFLFTRADETYERQFRKHVAWWTKYVSTAEYRKKVPPFRWPTFPLRIVIEECGS